LANGLPLITTHGARGLTNGKDFAFLVAEDERNFLKHLTRLTTDPEYRRTIGDDVIAYVKTHFTPNKCFDNLISIINGQ
jgi:hypothetical protein